MRFGDRIIFFQIGLIFFNEGLDTSIADDFTGKMRILIPFKFPLEKFTSVFTNFNEVRSCSMCDLILLVVNLI